MESSEDPSQGPWPTWTEATIYPQYLYMEVTAPSLLYTSQSGNYSLWRGWGWRNKRTKVMCKVCTWRMASGEGKGPRHLRIQEYFQTKGPRALPPGSFENFCFIRVEEEAAQTHLLAPGTCLIPADLLVLLCGCRAASGTPQCWIGRDISPD